MATTDYYGPANSSALFPHLIGETIKGVMLDGPHFVVVFGSGEALVLTSLGGEVRPSFWTERKERVTQRIRKRRVHLKELLSSIEATAAFEDDDNV